ncbi:hypothetical protein WBG78_14265 [Chryseolinea sp. T2]|uniref:hypothetical protein n=1 Tax=Chryseolinea sp. T2 TaxID=3129255 RepID=UPI0030789EDA
MKRSSIVLVGVLTLATTLFKVASLSAQVIYGDTVLVEIPEEQRRAFINSIKQKVVHLQHYITNISDKKIDLGVRLEQAESAIKLFSSEDNIVQVSNVRTGKITQMPVRSYFRALANIKATKVEITFYKGVQFETIRRGSDGYYYGTALMFQETTITKGENAISYRDRTIKRVNFKSRQEFTFIGDEKIQIIETFLQDIDVTETTI